MAVVHNRRIVLASRPVGAPVPDNFRIETLPVAAPGDGQVLVHNRLLSLDPYMYRRMIDGPSYDPPLALGATMVGATVGRVVESRRAGFAAGDLVLAYGGWQEYSLSDGTDLNRLPADFSQPSYALGVLGMPGYTAYHGLLRIGVPQAGETVVVSAATGAVGSVVGQLAKLRGCRAVGIAGGSEKCGYAVRELGFDACIDHRAANLRELLTAECPKGIDVYFENVGGAVLRAVLPLLNVGARIPVCGQIAGMTQTALPDGPDRTGNLTATVLVKRLRMQGFIISDHYGEPFLEFSRDMRGWLGSGAIRYREYVVDGFEAAPATFIEMMRGGNLGKTIVRLGDL